MRAFCGFAADDFVRVVRHLLGLPNVSMQAWSQVTDALPNHAEGLDFADALHLLACDHCTELLTFDNKRFAYRAMRMGLHPSVVVAQ